MVDGPLAVARRRLARSIDWRVDRAVSSAFAARQAELVAASSGDESGTDALARLVVLETKVARLDAAIDQLRTLIASASATLSDEQRSQGELLVQITDELRALSRAVADRPDSTTV